MSVLSLRSLRKTYGPVTALDGVSLDVASGSRMAIVGPSGSGKTTLLRLIAGFDAPDSGSIHLGEESLADGGKAVPAHRRGIGIVAQDGALFPHLSIADNVGFGLDRNMPGRDERISDLIHMVGLDSSMLPRKPDQLSGGQQQRVALARALAREPRLMLLDEPFSALDTGLRASTRKAVSDLLGAHGITTVLVTHDQSEALSFADQVAVMHEGRLLQAGPPRDLYLRPKTALIAEFLGDALILDAEVSQGLAQCALGRVRLHEGCADGKARIRLRPEQISLVRASGEPARGECRAVVTHSDFGGATCLVTLQIMNGHAQGEPSLVLRRSGIDELAAGTPVRIEIFGQAHAFS